MAGSGRTCVTGQDGDMNRRALRWSGFVLIAAGLVVLGYVGWQLYGTTWLAQRHQSDVVAATERAWSAPEGRSVSSDDTGLAEDVVAVVRIPAFGDDYAVPVYAGTDDDTLTRGFGLFGSSPDPGDPGNLALAGHRITQGEPLRQMPELRPGDEVEIRTRDAVYTYTLDTAGDALTVGFDEDWVLQERPVDPESGATPAGLSPDPRLLTLVTCAEIFHTDDRLVAFGHLTDVVPVG